MLFGGTTGGDQPISGKIYAVNADTGKPAWTFEILRDHPDSWPGGSRKRGGGSAWMPGTYDPRTDTIYIGTANAAPDYFNADRKGDNKWTASRLDARDPLTGKLKWSIRCDLPPLSSVLTTAGGVVFTGDMDGRIYAYDADDGKALWRFSAGSGLRGGPVSYAAGGRQYIVVPTGLGSHAPGFLAGAYPQIKDLFGGAALIAFTVD